MPDYRQFTVSLTQNSTRADSVMIIVRGGNKLSTAGSGSALWIDYLSVH
jgi:hypothetical protein